MSNKFYVICLVLMLLAAGGVASIFFRNVPDVVQTNLERIPMAIGGYSATEDSFSDSIYRELNADKHIYRHYRDREGNQIDLYIGYYGTAKGGRTGHNPYACLPGAGWAIVDSQKTRIRYPTPFSDVKVNYVRASRDGANTIMVHWYQTATTVMSTGIQQNLERFWGRILRNRNDGAFVQVTINVPDDHVIDAESKVRDFAGLIIKIIPEYWPIEK